MLSIESYKYQTIIKDFLLYRQQRTNNNRSQNSKIWSKYDKDNCLLLFWWWSTHRKYRIHNVVSW